MREDQPPAEYRMVLRFSPPIARSEACRMERTSFTDWAVTLPANTPSKAAEKTSLRIMWKILTERHDFRAGSGHDTAPVIEDGGRRRLPIYDIGAEGRWLKNGFFPSREHKSSGCGGYARRFPARWKRCRTASRRFSRPSGCLPCARITITTTVISRCGFRRLRGYRRA